jgi:hypothetical protein
MHKFKPTNITKFHQSLRSPCSHHPLPEIGSPNLPPQHYRYQYPLWAPLRLQICRVLLQQVMMVQAHGIEGHDKLHTLEPVRQPHVDLNLPTQVFLPGVPDG